MTKGQQLLHTQGRNKRTALAQPQKKKIKQFLGRDENSRTSTGKKGDCDKEKRQKRFLNPHWKNSIISLGRSILTSGFLIVSFL